MQRELPTIERLDGVDIAAAARSGCRHLEDSLRLGTYDPAVHRAALNELRDDSVAADHTQSGQRPTTAAQSSLRVNLMFIALLGVVVAMACRVRMRSRAGCAA